MIKIYKNVYVWDSSRDKASLCDVKVREGKFEEIAPAGNMSSKCAFDGKCHTALIPGFVNAHGHSPMGLLRGFGEDAPLMEWLQKKIWPREDKLNDEDMYNGSRLAIAEMLSTGTTCFADMYFFMNKVAKACEESGIRANLSRCIMGDQIETDTKITENIELAAQYNKQDGLIRTSLGPHATYTVPFEAMKKVAQVAKKYNFPVQLHWLEASNEWEISNHSEGMSPENYLEETGLCDVPHLLLAHCVHIRENAYKFYARPNFTIAHNPKSNLKLGNGIAPIEAYRKAGVSVAIGTDGSSSNNRLDMWEELRFAALLQKGKDPTAMPIKELFEMATGNGARALGFEKLGLIKEGYKADFILIDLDKPHYLGVTEENLHEFLAYAGSSSDIRATVVAGQTLYQDGAFTTFDIGEVMAKAKETRKKII